MQLIQFCYKRGTVFIQASIPHRQCHGIRYQRKSSTVLVLVLLLFCSSGERVLAQSSNKPQLSRATSAGHLCCWKRALGAVLLAPLKSPGNKLQLGHELLLSEPPATGHLFKGCISSEADPLLQIGRLAVLLIRRKKQNYYNSFTRSPQINKRASKYMTQAGD